MNSKVLKFSLAGLVMVVLAVTIIFASGPSHAQNGEETNEASMETAVDTEQMDAAQSTDKTGCSPECMKVCEDAGYTAAEIEAYCATKSGDCKKECTPGKCK